MENSGEKMLLIPIGEYLELIRKAERIETIERMCSSGQYVNTDDMKAILGIETKEVTE